MPWFLARYLLNPPQLGRHVANLVDDLVRPGFELLLPLAGRLLGAGARVAQHQRFVQAQGQHGGAFGHAARHEAFHHGGFGG